MWRRRAAIPAHKLAKYMPDKQISRSEAGTLPQQLREGFFSLSADLCDIREVEYDVAAPEASICFHPGRSQLRDPWSDHGALKDQTSLSTTVNDRDS